MIGQRFGRLVVLAEAGVRQAGNARRMWWRVRCDCGAEKEVVATLVKTGTTRSCGCLRSPPEADRFWSKVEKTDSCWLWKGSRGPLGYGHIFWRGQWPAAHRVAYELSVGPIPARLVLDHLCRNPSCVNPAHLEPVTTRENTMRGVGPAPRRAAQTHCLRGHELAGDNVYIHKSRRVRVCRTCHRNRVREASRRKAKRADREAA